MLLGSSYQVWVGVGRVELAMPLPGGLYTVTTAERGRKKLKGCKDVYLKVKARIWP